MSEAHEAGAEAGDQSFEREFDAAREAQEPGDRELATDAAPEAEAAAEAKTDQPPLTIEEIRKRLNDQQGATREERQRRRALEAEIRELRAAHTQQPAKPAGDGAPKARPNPQEDPIGYLEYVEEMLQAGEQKAQEQQQQTEQQRQAQQQMQAVVSRVEEFENDFREMNPDYNEAAEHLYTAKIAEYVDSGYSAADAHTAVMGEFFSRSRRALDSGKDPAEIVYNLAKRAGFASKAGDQKLDAIEKGQRRTSPLARPGGGSGELTPESVSKLSGAAFDSAFAKLQERARHIERTSGL